VATIDEQIDDQMQKVVDCARLTRRGALLDGVGNG
jgi:hypothetical protein